MSKYEALILDEVSFWGSLIMANVVENQWVSLGFIVAAIWFAWGSYKNLSK